MLGTINNNICFSNVIMVIFGNIHGIHPSCLLLLWIIDGLVFYELFVMLIDVIRHLLAICPPCMEESTCPRSMITIGVAFSIPIKLFIIDNLSLIQIRPKLGT